MGGNARAGLGKSNGGQVARIIRITKELGIETATPSEARDFLGLKGLDKMGV